MLALIFNVEKPGLQNPRLSQQDDVSAAPIIPPRPLFPDQ
jgi:hypothetical protein